MNKAELVADLREMIDDLPITFSVGGIDYTGTDSQQVKEKKLEEGGFLETFDRMIYAVIDDFTDAGASVPEPGALFTIGGVNFRVDKVTRDLLEAGVEFGLNTPHR